MSSLTIGTFVLYRPTRVAFAVSSGSWSNMPANKYRPCLVHDLSQREKYVIIPLLGAIKDSSTNTYVLPDKATFYQWSPVRLMYRDYIEVPYAPPGLTQRPITVVDNPNIEPIIPFKPSYIWTADEGEEIPSEIVDTLNPHLAYGYVQSHVRAYIRAIIRRTQDLGLAPRGGSGIILAESS